MEVRMKKLSTLRIPLGNGVLQRGVWQLSSFQLADTFTNGGDGHSRLYSTLLFLLLAGNHIILI